MALGSGGVDGGAEGGELPPIDLRDPSTWAGLWEGDLIGALEDPSSWWEEGKPAGNG